MADGVRLVEPAEGRFNPETAGGKGRQVRSSKPLLRPYAKHFYGWDLELAEWQSIYGPVSHSAT